jgi:hypothetical protein
MLLKWTAVYGMLKRRKTSDLFVYAPEGRTNNNLYPNALQ